MNIIEERYQIAIDRIREIKTEELVEKQYIRYFQTVSEFILKLDFVSRKSDRNGWTVIRRSS